MWWPLWVLSADVSCLQGPDTSQGGTELQQPQAAAAQGGQQLRVPTFLVNAGQPNEVCVDMAPSMYSHPAAYCLASLGDSESFTVLGCHQLSHASRTPYPHFSSMVHVAHLVSDLGQISLTSLLGLHRGHSETFELLSCAWRQMEVDIQAIVSEGEQTLSNASLQPLIGQILRAVTGQAAPPTHPPQVELSTLYQTRKYPLPPQEFQTHYISMQRFPSRLQSMLVPTCCLCLSLECFELKIFLADKRNNPAPARFHSSCVGCAEPGHPSGGTLAAPQCRARRKLSPRTDIIFIRRRLGDSLRG